MRGRGLRELTRLAGSFCYAYPAVGRHATALPMDELTSLTDRALIERCLGGDGAAWSELLRRYRRVIYAVPQRMGLPAEDCAEVFQRVCLLLYEHLGRVRDPDRIGGWLTTTCRREAWLVARASSRRAVSHVSLDADPDAGQIGAREPADPRPLADEECAEIERAAILRSTLEQLSERCRLILAELLREDETTNYTEVAARLGIPRGSLGPTRARCLARLRELLRERGLDGI